MGDIKRICSLCNEDATPKKPYGGIMQFNNRRGNSLGLFCNDCYPAVIKAVDESPRCFRHSGLSETEINRRTMERARELVKKNQ